MSPSRKALLLIPVAVALLSQPAASEIVERVVAAVNGDIITLSEFESRQIAAVQANRVPQDQIAAFLRQNNARLLQEAIDELLIIQRGDVLGLRVPEEYIQGVIDNIKQENEIETDAQLQQQLRREGMTIDDLKRQVERSIVHRQVLNTELPPISLTEAEARAYYEEHKADMYTKPATVKLQEIFVDAERPDAAARARELYERALAGEDFALLASLHSDSPTAESGGDLGELVVGEMNPAIEKVAAALPPGGVSEPRASLNGYQILKVVEKTEATQVPFDSIKDEIMRELAREREAEEYETYVAGLRENAVIDYRVREVGLQVETPTGPSLLDDARKAGEAGPAAPADDEFSVSGSPTPAVGGAEEDEFSVSGPAQPTRVVPGADPLAPAPTPTPTPEPQPEG